MSRKLNRSFTEDQDFETIVVEIVEDIKGKVDDWLN